MAIIIFTDSTSDLPLNYRQDYEVKVVPLNVHIGNQVFKDGIDISNREYYQRLRQEPIFPQTSQPSCGEFLQAFQVLKPEDTALVILISSVLSGTLQSAKVARDMLADQGTRVEIIDSLSAAIPLGFQVMQACDMASRGEDVATIKKSLEKIRDDTQVFFVVDNLEYLSRGGRISKVASHIGNILQLKPILTLKEGTIQVFDKVRTRQKALNRIINEMKSAGPISQAAVIQIDAPQEAENLFSRIREFYSGPLYITEPGPVIGTHVGPGTLGIAYY